MRKFVILLSVLLAVLPIEAKRKRKAAPPRAVRTQLAPADARRLSYFYQEGIKQKLNGHLSEAYDLFLYCLAIDPNDPDALFEAGYLNFYLGQDSVGTEMFRRAAEIDDQNPRYIQSLAAAYLSGNDQERAIPVVERLSQLQTRRSDVLYQLVELYKNSGKTDDAIRALDRIEVLEGRTLQTALQKYALYVDRGRQQDAYNVLKSLEEESPYDMRIPIILGRRYLENQDAERALECFDRVAKNEPQNADLRLAMMEYYEQTGQRERRTALRDSLLYAPESSDEVRAQMASVLIYDLKGAPDQRQRVMQVLDSLVRISPSALMHSMRVSYMMGAKMGEDTVAQAMRELLVVAPDNENALSRLLAYYLGRQDFDQVAEICRMGINTHPESLTFYFYLAVAMSQTKQNAQGVEVLQSGLKQAGEQTNPEQLSDFYELLGQLYYEEGRAEEAFAAYDSCLVYKDDNAACLNNYAYYLSLRNERLDDAERMSYRAIKMEPLNKTYLDTYAWVLFMQGNYTMAKFYIDRVVPPTQTDSSLVADADLHAEVLEHAGDIYALCDDLEQAQRYWSLAQQKGSDSALLAKKLKLKKYIKD